ncbi:hypothetical protein [Cellulomonas alba]|uniref:Uncharacterized protein n=1 Tax=Cellulomonas alba TaxID=3053467 RepID=A0ABT7SE48_9CELL|nr:hypothetical protein [Cellulomonas alba]MDM7854454.1 hypothetical protein [Cellulomonas alba]
MNHPTPDPHGNPLSHALDDAAGWPESLGYDVPVTTIRRRVRRRRTARRAALSGGACVLAAGVVVAAPAVWGAVTTGHGGRVAAGSTSGGSTASDSLGGGVAPLPNGSEAQGDDGAGGDWPAQFDRCGKPLADPPDPTELTLRGATVAADGTWQATTVARRDDGMHAEVVGTDVSLVRDGVVVAVQEGAQVQQPEGPTTASPHRPGIYGTISTPVTAHLASCAQYPVGHGSPVVEPGTYELVVVQTLAMTGDGGDWTQHAVARSTVTVPAAG